MKNQISKLYSAVSAPVAASRDALAERLQSVRDTASLLYNRMMNNIGYGQETLKDIVENTAEEEHQEEEQENNADLTPKEHETALKGAFRSFRSPGLPKADVDTYIERITPHQEVGRGAGRRAWISKSTAVNVGKVEEARGNSHSVGS